MKKSLSTGRWLGTSLRVALLSFGAIVGMTGASANDRPDFGVAYDFVQTVPIDDQTTAVTIRARIQNVSGQYVANAVVFLMNENETVDLGSFPGLLNLDDYGSTTLEASFDVPNDVLQQWQSSAGAQFAVVYTGADGQSQRRPADAARMPVGVEVQP